MAHPNVEALRRNDEAMERGDLEEFMEAMGEEYSFENQAYLADDEHGVVLQRSTAKRGGKTFAVDEVFVFRFRDGIVSDMTYTALDQAAFDRWVG